MPRLSFTLPTCLERTERISLESGFESPRGPGDRKALGVGVWEERGVCALSSHNVAMVRKAERNVYQTDRGVPRAFWWPGDPATGSQAPAWGPARLPG